MFFFLTLSFFLSLSTRGSMHRWIYIHTRRITLCTFGWNFLCASQMCVNGTMLDGHSFSICVLILKYSLFLSLSYNVLVEIEKNAANRPKTISKRQKKKSIGHMVDFGIRSQRVGPHILSTHMHKLSSNSASNDFVMHFEWCMYDAWADILTVPNIHSFDCGPWHFGRNRAERRAAWRISHFNIEF